jgi:hypothetical protein
MVRSTIQCFGRAVNFFVASDRLTISVETLPRLLSVPLKRRPLIAGVGIELQQERKQTKERAYQQHAAIPILNVRRVDQRGQQEALGINQDLPLLHLDFLICITPIRVSPSGATAVAVGTDGPARAGPK